MSVVIEVFLICDGHLPGCHENFGVDNRNFTIVQHRAGARLDGWVRSGNKDLCPNCRKRKKDGTHHKPKKRKHAVANA